jgi:2-polyprenyl-6-methoxyphenol hydroxylase-like FAD-dependent oxidoreductase
MEASPQKVVVVGAGLAGVMLALLLARRKDAEGRNRFEIHVFEKRGDFRSKATERLTTA